MIDITKELERQNANITIRIKSKEMRTCITENNYQNLDQITIVDFLILLNPNTLLLVPSPLEDIMSFWTSNKIQLIRGV